MAFQINDILKVYEIKTMLLSKIYKQGNRFSNIYISVTSLILKTKWHPFFRDKFEKYVTT